MYWKQNVVNFQFTLLMNQTKSCKICMNHFQSDTVTFNVHFCPSKVYLHLSFCPLCAHCKTPGSVLCVLYPSADFLIGHDAVECGQFAPRPE